MWEEKLSSFVHDIFISLFLIENLIPLNPRISQEPVTNIHGNYITPNLLLIFAKKRKYLHTSIDPIPLLNKIRVLPHHTRYSQPFKDIKGNEISATMIIK